MRRILVTNDDGYFSPGIKALAEALHPLGEVTIVAPQTEASAVGHALTLRRPLRLEPVGERIYAVDGTPTDCVNLGLNEVLGGRVDLVVSGINLGLNIGDDVTYSGTVAGALEGALLGIQAMAVSLEFTRQAWNFAPAASLAASLAGALLANPLPFRTFLNVNLPLGPLKGVRVTSQAVRNHVTKIDRRTDPRGRDYFWIEEAQDEWQASEHSDYQAIRDGMASITPLQPDWTHHSALDLARALAEAAGATTGVR
jgi:5'-nucleotidase